MLYIFDKMIDAEVAASTAKVALTGQGIIVDDASGVDLVVTDLLRKGVIGTATTVPYTLKKVGGEAAICLKCGDYSVWTSCHLGQPYLEKVTKWLHSAAGNSSTEIVFMTNWHGAEVFFESEGRDNLARIAELGAFVSRAIPNGVAYGIYRKILSEWEFASLYMGVYDSPGVFAKYMYGSNTPSDIRNIVHWEEVGKELLSTKFKYGIIRGKYYVFR